MKRYKLELIPTKGMSRQEWLGLREYGLGGSDISTIRGYNDNFPLVELFYQKLGLNNFSDEDNEAMFWGRHLEDPIREVAEYYPTIEGEIYMNEVEEGIASGQKKQIVKPFPYIVVNPEIPWLRANVDGVINPKGTIHMHFFNGVWQPRGLDNFSAEAVFEAKTISRFMSEKWESKYPPYYACQQLVYMMILKPILRKLESHIFILKDGREFFSDLIPWNDEEAFLIVRDSKLFWDSVKEGKKIIANTTNVGEREHLLAKIEPGIEDTKAYEKFYNKKWLAKQNYITIDGDTDMAELIREYNHLGEDKKPIDKRMQFIKNYFKRLLTIESADVINFEDFGKLTWNKDVNRLFFPKKLV